MAENVADPDILGDKERLKLYKKAEELVEEVYEIRNLVESVCNENYLGRVYFKII